MLSEGDAAVHGPQARAFGPNGTGVSVGVISDSINQLGSGIAGSVSTGNLPANTQVLSEDPGGSDEGRAMAEIVYDEAPRSAGSSSVGHHRVDREGGSHRCARRPRSQGHLGRHG